MKRIRQRQLALLGHVLRRPARLENLVVRREEEMGGKQGSVRD